MEPYRIYNKSSASMQEVANGSVDLVMTSPPYNIGAVYGNNTDKLSLEDYQVLLRGVFAESNRILRPGGTMIVECADSILSDGAYIQLAAYCQSLCLALGLAVRARHINFAHSLNGVELPENEKWSQEYVTRVDNHSNAHQILVFSKSPGLAFNPDGKIMYFDYVSVEGHPCPTPRGVYDFVLDSYFKEGMTVADPFMGTAILGAEVIKRNGTFVGYELDPSVFALAQKNLEAVVR